MDNLTIAYDKTGKPTVLVGKSAVYSAHLAKFRDLMTDGSSKFVHVEVWRSGFGRVKNKAVPSVKAKKADK